MNVTFDWKEVLVLTHPRYTQKVTLSNIAVVLNIYYNEKAKAWYMDIKDDGGDYYICGIRLIPNYLILTDYPSLPFTGFFRLQSISNEDNDNYKNFENDSYNMKNWYKLFYIDNLEAVS